MKSNKVTDPSILAQLNGSSKKVTDPALLAKLNGEDEEDQGAYLDNLPEPEGFWHKLPRNILTGLANLGHSTLNLPHDLVQTAENAGESFGNSITKSFPLPPEVQKKLDSMPKHEQFKLSEHIPQQEENNYAELLGQKGEGTLMDNIIQKGVEYAPEIASGRALIKSGLRKFPITKKAATQRLKNASNMVDEVDPELIPISKKSLHQAMEYLPKTHATREMLEAAARGEYGPSFSLQSQVGKHARDLSKSSLASERLLAPHARELKQTILDEVETGLRKGGYHEIADEMKGGIDDYRKFIKFWDKASPVLKKLKIPTTGLAILGLSSDKTKKFISKLFD